VVAHALDAAGMEPIAWTPNEGARNLGLWVFVRRGHSAILPASGMRDSATRDQLRNVRFGSITDRSIGELGERCIERPLQLPMG
jgi:hypothetical protein